MTPAEALRVLLVDESIGDMVYQVRERAVGADPKFKGNSWDHPRVKRFSEAVTTLQEEHVRLTNAQIAPRDTTHDECRRRYLALVDRIKDVKEIADVGLGDYYAQPVIEELERVLAEATHFLVALSVSPKVTNPDKQ